MRCLGGSPWSEQRQPRSKHGKRARIPTRPDNGRGLVSNCQPPEGLFMGMKRFSMERRALHDRCAVAKNLRRCVEDSVCWHANQRAIDVFPLTKESDDRNMSEVMRQPFDSTCGRRTNAATTTS